MPDKTKKLAASALLLALDVVFTRMLAINTPLMKIGFGFVAVAVCAMLYGPCWAAAVAALADAVGAMLFPTGAFFPGFTLTAAMTGLVFGLCLYEKEISWLRALLAGLLNCAVVGYLGNTAMISYVSGADYGALLVTRSAQLLIMLPVQTLTIRAIGASGVIEKIK